MIKKRSFGLWLLGTIYTLLLCWLYYPVIWGFFANDDWVLLWHNSSIPVAKPWLFFNPHTVWFYRPLQSLEFGLTRHFANLFYPAYAIQLLIMHLVVCFLAWKQIGLLFGNVLAFISLLIFSTTCLAPDTLLWISNFNTLHYAILALASSCAFTKHLQTKQNKWYIISLFAAAACSFTKESCVNIPLILTAIWLTHHLKRLWAANRPQTYTFRAKVLKAATSNFVKTMFPFALITIAYVILHRLFVVNTESIYELQYYWAPPIAAVGQLISMINFSIFGLVTYPLQLLFPGKISTWLYHIVINGYPVPLILLGYAIARRSIIMVFCLAFAAANVFPTFLLTTFHVNRYYYPTCIAGALLIASLTQRSVRLILDWLKGNQVRFSRLPTASRVKHYAAGLLLLCIVVLNVVVFQLLIANNHKQSVFVRQAFEYIQKHGRELPKQSVVRFELRPNEFLHQGMGSSEMLWVATGRTDLFAVANGGVMPESLKQQMDKRQHKYVFKVFTMTPQFTPTNEIWPYPTRKNPKK